MKKNVGTRLPSFTKSESEQLKGSYDFIGLNYYYSLYVSYDSSIPTTGPRDLTSDMFARFTDFVDVPPIHTIIPPSHPKNDFLSLRKMLNHLKMTYRNPPIYIHENGFGFGVPDTMHDVQRISSISGYIRSVCEAIRDGADVRGYFVWAFVDVYEWISGYAERYGLFHVSFEENGLDRTPRLSAHWYRDFLTNGSVVKIANLGRTSPRAHSS